MHVIISHHMRESRVRLKVRRQYGLSCALTKTHLSHHNSPGTWAYCAPEVGLYNLHLRSHVCLKVPST